MKTRETVDSRDWSFLPNKGNKKATAMTRKLGSF